MSEVDLDDPPVERDAKAGFSSWCRRGQHQSCFTAGARCTCSCHGRHGQTPPAAAPHPTPIIRHPEHKEGTPMPDTDSTMTRQSPTPNPDGYTCDDCGRKFPTSAGLGGHRKIHTKSTEAQTPPQRRAAPAKQAAARPAARRPKLDTASVRAALDGPDDDYDPWVVLVGHVNDGNPTVSALVLSTSNDAEQTAALLTTLGHKAWRLRLADAQNGA